jgi:hypothetical protein
LGAAPASFCGASGAAAAPPASSIRATTALIETVAPSSTSTSVNVPAAGDGISVSTLSVEISAMISSRSTVSPGCFSQRRMVPSCTDSPIFGIKISVAIVLFSP